jgi:Zn-dependent protease
MLRRPGVVVPEMGDADAFHLTVFVKVVDYPVGHYVDIALRIGQFLRFRRIFRIVFPVILILLTVIIKYRNVI